MKTKFDIFKQSEVLELLLINNYLVFSRDNVHLEWNKAIEN